MTDPTSQGWGSRQDITRWGKSWSGFNPGCVVSPFKMQKSNSLHFPVAFNTRQTEKALIFTNGNMQKDLKDSVYN